jgi:hypothetical protein
MKTVKRDSEKWGLTTLSPIRNPSTADTGLSGQSLSPFFGILIYQL